jgi:predicted glycosyltransferase
LTNATSFIESGVARVWVDLSNSPHPILFEPIVDELRRAGHEVFLTARDHAQTLPLARERWPEVEVIGAPSPPGRAAKVRAIAARAARLARFARDKKLDVAVSHNSYAQAVAARRVGIPCVTAMDYEYQPANHIAFRFAQRILVPEEYPDRLLRAQGGTARKVWRYDGFKEEVYLQRFTPSAQVLAELNLAAGEPFFVARPSPAGATYHQFENPLFDRALSYVLSRGEAKVVLLPRRAGDVRAFQNVPPERQIVPDRPVDTRSLLYYATAMLGAGGTMNREAALLGTPVFGLYSGRLAALDRRLIRQGRLHPLTEDSDQLESKLEQLLATGSAHEAPVLTRHVLDRFLDAILDSAGRPATRSAAASAHVADRSPNAGVR